MVAPTISIHIKTGPREVNCDAPEVVYREPVSRAIVDEPGDGYYTRYYGVTVHASDPDDADTQFDDFVNTFRHSMDIGFEHEATNRETPVIHVSDTFEPIEAES